MAERKYRATTIVESCTEINIKPENVRVPYTICSAVPTEVNQFKKINA